MAKTAIALSIELKESTELLVGSGSWVRKKIEEGELVVTNTTSGRPAVFLRYTDTAGKQSSQGLATYAPDYK
jgi:hypothetical protein